MKTTVKKSIGHDRMSISAKFPSGGTYRWNISWAGERLTIAFSDDVAVAKNQIATMQKWLKLRKGESRLDAFNRLEALTKTCSSGKELISKMK